MNLPYILALATLVGQILLIVSVLAYVSSEKYRQLIKKYTGQFGDLISFFVALFAMLISLYFSDVVGWDPCVLCWYQRIAMYPLVVVFAIGVWKQDASARIYGMSLAVIGLAISVYQIYLQILGSYGTVLSGFCSAVGATDCSEIYMLEFGYITFPVAAATGFLSIILIQFAGGRDTINS